jgi:hypothetical protein
MASAARSRADGVMATTTAAIRQPACAGQRGCAACLLEPHCHARARSDPQFVLDIRTNRRIIRKASLIMRYLPTKGREEVGCGYTNRAAGGQRE